MTERATPRVLALSGGVGGARLAAGLQQVLAPGALSVLVNTADDFEHLGLAVCPDLDTVLYTLADRHDRAQGWGRADETWRTMQALAELGGPDWFRLGDTDLATHLRRTHRLREGATLSTVTAELAASLRVPSRLLPMSDSPVRTMIDTDIGPLAFQHWFVRERCKSRVTRVRFEGAEQATPAPGLSAALRSAQAIVVGPSNPWLSVDPILRVPGLAAALRDSGLPIWGVSPIIGGRAIKGPAAQMMAWFGTEVSAFGVAQWYAQHHAGCVQGWVIDREDAALAPRIAALGLQVHVCDTMMVDLDAAAQLARELLDKACSSSIGRT